MISLEPLDMQTFSVLRYQLWKCISKQLSLGSCWFGSQELSNSNSDFSTPTTWAVEGEATLLVEITKKSIDMCSDVFVGRREGGSCSYCKLSKKPTKKPNKAQDLFASRIGNIGVSCKNYLLLLFTKQFHFFKKGFPPLNLPLLFPCAFHEEREYSI